MKFPQGEGSAVIHRKKNRPALQRRDILTVSSLSSFFRELTQIFFHPVLSGSALYSFLCISVLFKTLLFRLFVRSLSTQLIFLVFLFRLLPSMTAFSYVGFLSLFWVRLFFFFFTQVFSEPSSTQHFSWGIVFWAVCRARIRSVVSFFSSSCSLAFLSFGVPFAAICRAVLIYLVLFSGLF